MSNQNDKDKDQLNKEQILAAEEIAKGLEKILIQETDNKEPDKT